MSDTVERGELLLASLDKQHLLEKTDMASVVSNLCGLQAQFANNPGHALRVRAHDFAARPWHHGLVKTWTFRRTMHVVREDELGLFLSAQGVPEKWTDDWGVSRKLKPRLSAALAGWIREGDGRREELKDRCRDAGIGPEVLANVFHGWGGLLKEMCQRGIAAYAPNTEKRFIACDGVEFMERDKARAILLERYFRFLGPATMADCAAFTGYTRKEIQAVLAAHPLPLRSVECGGATYWHLGGWDSSRAVPSCLFLSGFDQLLLAYKDRSRLVDDKHKPDVVTNTGIIHPTILVDGRLKAKWKLSGKTLKVTPFGRLSLRARKRIDSMGMKFFKDRIREVIIVEG